MSEWREAFATLFPRTKAPAPAGMAAPSYQPAYAEEDVDSVVRRKNEELDAYLEQQRLNVDRWKMTQRALKK